MMPFATVLPAASTQTGITLPEFLALVASTFQPPRAGKIQDSPLTICEDLVNANDCQCPNCLIKIADLYKRYGNTYLKQCLVVQAYAQVFQLSDVPATVDEAYLLRLLAEVEGREHLLVENPLVANFWDQNIKYLSMFNQLEHWLTEEMLDAEQRSQEDYFYCRQRGYATCGGDR